MNILEKPHIKLIRSSNGKYFFDVNTNEIVPLSDATFEYYNAILQNRNSCATPEICQEIDDLTAGGYLSCNKVKTIEDNMSDYLEVLLDRCVAKITQQLTENSNVKSSYSPYSQENILIRLDSQKTMSIETAKKGIDFLRDHSVDADEFSVGEPMIEFELLKEITAYAQEVLKGKKLIFNETTNINLQNDDAK